MPSSYQLVNKDKQFTYIHNRDGSRSNLDHIIVSRGSLVVPPVIVLDDKIEDDHLPLTCEIESSALLALNIFLTIINGFISQIGNE